MAKPFFYRIDAAEFVAAVLQIPDGQHKQWVTQLALDMVSGTGTMDFSKKIIEEVENYRKKQAEAGAKGGKPKHKQPYSDPIPEESDTVPPPKQNLGNSSNRSSSSTETKEENKKHILVFFESLWKDYPSNDGKKDALRHYKATVKTDGDCQRIRTALNNYLAHLKCETWKKPKNGSTWFNNWEDWEHWEPDLNNKLPLPTTNQTRKTFAQQKIDNTKSVMAEFMAQGGDTNARIGQDELYLGDGGNVRCLPG